MNELIYELKTAAQVTEGQPCSVSKSTLLDAIRAIRALEEIATMPIGRNFQAEATQMRELAQIATTKDKTGVLSDWRNQGFYLSSSPCCVCRSTSQTGQEPRFGYVVCEQHSKLSPVEISKRRTDGK